MYALESQSFTLKTQDPFFISFSPNSFNSDILDFKTIASTVNFRRLLRAQKVRI